MNGRLSVGRRLAYGLAALAVAGMTLSTPAEAQSWKGQYPKGHVAPGGGYVKHAPGLRYGGYVGKPRYHAYHAYPGRAYGHRGYAHAYPRYHAYPGYAYANPGYAYPGYAYPGYAYGYGYPYGYYRKKRNNRAAIAAAVIGGMALGAILSSQARHPRKAYYKRRYH
jgi:hypothetical protein